MSSWLLSRGLESNSIYLILIIPFLTFVAVFARQFIELSTFGIYTPVIISASFFILGLWFGLLAFLFAVLTGYLVRMILNKFDLLYLPKVALNLSFISLSFLIVLGIGVYFGVNFSLSLAIFPILVMSTLSEKFMATQSEEGFRGALYGVLGTLVVIIISYFIITWSWFHNLLMSWPELIILPLILVLLMGKFTDLRLSEYLRFRSLFSEHIEE